MVETASIMELLNGKRISSNGRRHTADSQWKQLLQDTCDQCEKIRQAAVVNPYIEDAALSEIKPLLIAAKEECRRLIKACKVSCDRVIETIDGPRRAHKDHMDGLVKDVQKEWKEVRELLTPLASNYEAEFARELALLKSRSVLPLSIFDLNVYIS